jgi:hypothetical protein
MEYNRERIAGQISSGPSIAAMAAISWILSREQPDMMTAMMYYNLFAISLFMLSWTAVRFISHGGTYPTGTTGLQYSGLFIAICSC